MTKEEARAAAITAINAYADAIFAAQSARLTAKGTYLQRKATHTTPPTNGNTSAPDSIADTPTDENETGEEYFSFPAQMHTSASVNVSVGPDGQSFVCVFEFDWTADGMRQRYSVTGPDRVDSGWTEYDPNANPFP